MTARGTAPGSPIGGRLLLVEQGGRGGVADYTGCLAAALARAGVPVTLATAADHLYPPAPGVEVVPLFHYVRGHSRAARAARRAGLGPALNGLRFLVTLPRLLALARRAAVVHAQGFEDVRLGLLALPLLRLAGGRLVLTLHNTFERRPGLLDAARVWPLFAQRTIVHTESDRAALRRPTTVIPHGHYGTVAGAAAPADAASARAALGLGADVPVVLLFGHLRPDKGIGDLLTAVAGVPPWVALIAGQEDGGLAGVAEQLADPALAGRVVVAEGFQPIDAVAGFFAASDLVAIPYRQASQSGVLLLAYGFARPVVAYPVGGLGEAIRDGETGWLCAAATPEALADALRAAGRMGREELHRRGAEGERWAQERFSWDAIAAATVAVYRDA